MVNVNKLKGKIVEKGISISKLAETLNLAPSTLYRKLNDNGTTLTIGQVDGIVKSLGLNSIEASEIFFN
ncbi:MAG: helix-turn-helix domain-containing protein [Clostridium sp.]|uniref:helix-turn-helix domain-containing protein n=1 Tax=Clostridium sp. TaxID=1506 RepID=UPI002A755A59|nr:helix-turn-helix domain-containing protein [Clostridium sp.]MDY2632408.1 helix-turn-helix domain-containing protein [Clostridium sp.]